MTTTITPGQTKKATAYLERAVLSAVLKAFSPVLGEQPSRTEQTAGGPFDDFVWAKQSFEPADFGFVQFGLERTNALLLGRQFLAGSAAEKDEEAAALGALNEVLVQLGASLASSFSIKSKSDVRCKALSDQHVPSAEDRSFVIKLRIGDQSVDFVTSGSTELLETLATHDSDGESASAAIVPVSKPNARNLDLLLEVEMPVSISFGRTQLALKDVFKLTIGSVVELNRAISEPVDVIVNNSVIARGEVVVVEGNFGVRITQVMSRQDRLHSLT